MEAVEDLLNRSQAEGSNFSFELFCLSFIVVKLINWPPNLMDECMNSVLGNQIALCCGTHCLSHRRLKSSFPSFYYRKAIKHYLPSETFNPAGGALNLKVTKQ